MNFLVILICLTINYLWLKDFDRFDDGWFFRFKEKVDRWGSSAESPSAQNWVIALAILYGLPLLILALLLFVANGVFYGLATMLIHILVLLVAFDRTQPGKLASDFLAHWNAGDLESCKLYLISELKIDENKIGTDPEVLPDLFSKHFIGRCFEKMFVMFFWYMLIGPLGTLFCYISYQLRDCDAESGPDARHRFVKVAIRVLEWLPLRLLAITFSLAGNFVHCFDNLKQHFWDFSMELDYAELLFGYSTCALSGIGGERGAVSSGDHDGEEYRKGRAEEVEALQGLLERSQFIWLVVLAIITLLGINMTSVA